MSPCEFDNSSNSFFCNSFCFFSRSLSFWSNWVRFFSSSGSLTWIVLLINWSVLRDEEQEREERKMCMLKTQQFQRNKPVKPAFVVVNGIIVTKASIIFGLEVNWVADDEASISLKLSLKSTSLLPICKSFLLNRTWITAGIIDNNGDLISLQSSTISTLPKRIANSSVYVKRSACCVITSYGICSSAI